MSEAPAFSVEQLPEAVVIHVTAADFGETNVVAVRNGITEAAAGAPSLPFIVDMSTVAFMPSLTLGALVRMVSEFRARRQRLVFVGFQPSVRKVISITRLDRVMEIMDDISTAMKSVGIGA